ncbi:MAG TPA: hypothetical protein VFU17_05360 [Candidatus Limnocylindrales bacterium]|nr:hypothetical protein [Candidatus Limnocylindrales bacterium]
MNDRNQVQTALEQVREVLRGDEASGGGTTFMRGLTLGALLGAAIAGSALWQRRVKAKRPSSNDPPPVSGQFPARGHVGQQRQSLRGQIPRT